MKKLVFGCTLLIMGTIFAGYSFLIAIPFWVIGLIFVLFGFTEDKAGRQ